MTNENGNMYMPVAPAYGGYGNDGMFGGNGAWFILILLAMFGWGNGFGGWGGGNGAALNGDIQRGFDQAALTNGLTNVQTALCNGFAGVNQGVAAGFAQAEIAANSRQMADMNQQFALQSAMQNCCCENRAGIADLKFTVATEACADRNAISSALRDVLEANNASTQKILDMMCQEKIDAKNERIAELQQQLNMAQLAASQGMQTSTIIQTLNPAPIPAYVVAAPGAAVQTTSTQG